ncbi:MAG: hypothetical protein GXP54_08420, partial [Deltaproteobacteria bacterium]|nr:hypothetical protein [Deltaproteobacteria bacterium]
MRRTLVVTYAAGMLMLALGAATVCKGSGNTSRPPLDADQKSDAESSRFVLKSSAFADKAAIPRKFTCDGADVSPPLSWTNVPAGAGSLALTCF